MIRALRRSCALPLPLIAVANEFFDAHPFINTSRRSAVRERCFLRDNRFVLERRDGSAAAFPMLLLFTKSRRNPRFGAGNRFSDSDVEVRLSLITVTRSLPDKTRCRPFQAMPRPILWIVPAKSI
jgi:hypothetical protein